MKKYISAILIPCLLLQLNGCYSMQEVTKEEFSPAPDYPELYVKTKDKEYTFEEGNYIFTNDTIYGKGEIKLLVNPYVPFEGTISKRDVEIIDLVKIKSDTTDLIVKTREKEFIFKNDESSYSIENDTIYVRGKYKLREDIKQTFEGRLGLKEISEIQIDKFSLLNTLLLAYLVLGTIVWTIIFL